MAVGTWTTVGIGLDLTGALALASVAVWLLPRRERFGTAGGAMIAALLLTALWNVASAVALASPSSAVFAPSLTESARNLAWLAVIYRLFAGDGRHTSLAPIRPVIVSLAFVEVLHLGADFGFSGLTLDRNVLKIAFEFNVLLRLLVTVGGLVLIHNLYAGAPRGWRQGLRWPAAGLAMLAAFELNLYTIAYITGKWPAELATLRGLAGIALAVCIAIGASRNSADVRIRPSRAVTFQTFSLLVIGAYLVAMVAVAEWLSYAGGDFARLIELAFVVVASAFALVVLPSRRVRGWLKVIVAKHFFQHRYDYREEWLRFTRTIGSDQAAPLGERVVRSVADVFESPAGLLLAPGEQGELTLAARWNWPDIDVPARAIDQASVAGLEASGYIVDLDEVRANAGIAMPEWLLADVCAWALIPLVHYEKLVGMVVLARPQIARRFDWEDLDLLRVIGQQVASYLAENASQLALAESARFEDFHRRIAFVMHDIKNLASQFSLLARNAELHAEKPAFRADMLVTLRNSSDKLNALLARLSRYGSGAGERVETVHARDVLAAVMERFRAHPQVVLAQQADFAVVASRHSLEQVLVHLVQNALDASRPERPVFVSLSEESGNARFEVLDSGTGMSVDFVRNRLFKPFVSTKAGGFGIGAFEARELVRAMRGRLDVESREGLGSRFVVRLPIAAADTAPLPIAKVA
ncbi:XrtA/PEP-CTERM system histidine kinase PrsK [Novosphingobium sp. Leaf2]|uniref:XrtA/PEP-CTERM system histidine kinase PrsK n=1 Tax=Novosphingobium sp. Leaf2 TaxID=1735670 RepID=UPI0006F81BD7|nr:XrtA/PEP-CTERM system histidine kinase PrsK [Novosphingobium sp. Leaf2]KQM19315.1 histidine kinase [Novosphingobium sp. Leaf2]